MKIGYDRDSYNVRRNILDRVPGIQYIHTRDTYRLFAAARSRLRRLIRANQQRDAPHRYNAFRDFGLNRVDLFHFFNTISFGRNPWITTFETRVPRFGDDPDPARLRRGLRALAGPACRRLIAMSDCALRMQAAGMDRHPEFGDDIRPKLICLHPPQPPLVASHAAKPIEPDGPIRIVFVGNAYFRKGGAEMLAVLSELRKQGADLRLTIVSRIKMDPYAAGETSETVHRTRRMIGKRKDWVEHFESLPNENVLDIMRRSHLGLLPTYADTYGYSVLECQAAGCPVISTDVRALPEINADNVGWLINVPKDQRGEGLYATKSQRALMSRTIKDGLKKTLEEILQKPSLIAAKGNAALDRIRRDHSPQRFGEQLAAIYENALQAS